MTTVTADDVRALAQSGDDEPVLAVIDGEVSVLPGAEVGRGRVILTKEALLEDVGEEVTDVEAELLAGRLTADLAVADDDAGAWTDRGTGSAGDDRAVA